MANRKAPVGIIHSFNFGIIPREGILIMNYSADEAVAALNKIKAYDWAGAVAFKKKDFDKGQWLGGAVELMDKNRNVKGTAYYIYIPEKFNFSDFHQIKLAHEAEHVVNFVSKEAFDRVKEYEFSAYLLSHITAQCLNLMRGMGPNKGVSYCLDK